MSWSFHFSSHFHGALRLALGCLVVSCLTQELAAQQSLTWQQIRDRFESANPTLRAGEIGISESRAQEITAYLRPNPTFTVIADQIQPFPVNPYQALASLLPP